MSAEKALPQATTPGEQDIRVLQVRQLFIQLPQTAKLLLHKQIASLCGSEGTGVENSGGPQFRQATFDLMKDPFNFRQHLLIAIAGLPTPAQRSTRSRPVKNSARTVVGPGPPAAALRSADAARSPARRPETAVQTE